jgi:hypothetical protein
MIEAPVPFVVRATPTGLKDTVGFTILLRVIVAVPDDPAGTVMLVGLTDMLKSGGGAVTARGTVRIRTRVPLVALMLRL